MQSRFMSGCIRKQAESFDEMSNLSAALREKLKERCVLTTLKDVGGADFKNRRNTEISLCSS